MVAVPRGACDERVFSQEEAASARSAVLAARLVRSFTTGRRSLCQCEMSPVLVVVANVINQKQLFSLKFNSLQ